MTLITFIIPTYNTPTEWLQTCLESIHKLSLATDEREIIVVDDGSDQPLNETQISPFHAQILHQAHAGVSAARNLAIKNAKGKYIQFVDADDFLETKPYEEIINILQIEQVDAVGFAFKKRKRRSRPHHLCSGTDFVRRYNMFGSACSYVFLREKIANIEFPTDLQYGEDEFFTLKALLEMDLVRITNIKAYNYRKNVNSATSGNSQVNNQKRLNDHLQLIKHVDWFMYYLEGKKYKAAKRRIAQLAADYLHNTRRLTRGKNQTQAAREQLRQMHLYPLPLRCYTLKYFLQAICSRLK